MPNTTRSTILVVDDEPAVRTMLGRLLGAHGFRTFEAAGAEAALAIAHQERIDLVVTDVVMPGRSGVDLRRDLASIEPGLPVILISGFSVEGPAQLAETVPNTRFMQKPFAVDTLVQVIGQMLGYPGEGHRERLLS